MSDWLTWINISILNVNLKCKYHQSLKEEFQIHHRGSGQ